MTAHKTSKEIEAEAAAADDPYPTVERYPAPIELVAAGKRWKANHPAWVEARNREAADREANPSPEAAAGKRQRADQAREQAHYEQGIPARNKAKQFPTTEIGDSEFFASLCANRFRFDHTRRTWLTFDAHHWRPVDKGSPDEFAKIAMRERHHLAVDAQDKDLLKWSLKGESESRIRHLLRLAQSHPDLADHGRDYDADPLLLAVRNGVVNLRTGQRRDGRPTDRILKVCPVEHDSDATCPRWERFIAEIFAGEPELVDYIRRVFGYCLTGETGEQCFWLLYGEGSNGKSTLLETFTEHVLGKQDYSWMMPFPTDKWIDSKSDYQKAELEGRRVVHSSEVSQTASLNTDLIKTLTGGDTINGRRVCERPIQFKPVAKFLLRVNHLPKIHDESHAMWRRVKAIPFLQKFGVDDTLAPRLAAEAPGILNWAIRGCLEWQRNKLQHPDVVNKATEAYRESASPIAPFVDECCVLGELSAMRARQAWQAYDRYCQEHHVEQIWRLSDKAFYKAMEKRFSKVIKGTHKGDAAWFVGVGLKDVTRDTEY